MKTILFTGLLTIASIGIGCSSAQPMWRKPGVTPFDMQNTVAKCRYDVGLAKVTQNEKHEMIRDCMLSQGYRYN